MAKKIYTVRQLMELHPAFFGETLENWKYRVGLPKDVEVNRELNCVAAPQRFEIDDGKPDMDMPQVFDGQSIGPSTTPQRKPSNPKDNVGSTKLPFHLWPETATALGCLGLLDGEMKYGRSNYRAVGVRASVYYDACRRHLAAWFEGENVDGDSGVPHLGHALACLAILVEAEAAGNLNDDRMFPTNYRAWINTLTPHVARMQQKYQGQLQPVHYTITSTIPGQKNLGARSE